MVKQKATKVSVAAVPAKVAKSPKERATPKSKEVKSKKPDAENVAPEVSVKINENEEKKDVKNKELTVFTKEDADRIQVIKDQSCSALAALRKFVSQAGGKSLFPDIDHALQLVFVYKKPAACTNQSRHRILLPSSHRNITNTSVCLIMPDLDKSDKAKRDHDVDKQSREWAEKIEVDHGITNAQVAKIFTKTELERTTHTYKDQRALASSYDLFLVDGRVGKAVCSSLGKEFKRVHKKPLFFDYAKPLSTTIQTLIKTVNFPLEKYMTRASVPIGHLGQESEEILANVAAVLDEGLKVAPGGLRNIRGIHLQTSTSKPSLPIYADDGSSDEIKLKVEKQSQRPENKKTVDECSTLPEGLKLEIRKSGKMRVIREADGKAVMYPTIHDEWDEKDMPNTKPTINPASLANKKAKKRKLNEQRKIESDKFRAAAKLKVKKN